MIPDSLAPNHVAYLAVRMAMTCHGPSMCMQAGAATGTIAAFVEGPIDFYKSQIQVQIIRSRADPNYKRRPILFFTILHKLFITTTSQNVSYNTVDLAGPTALF